MGPRPARQWGPPKAEARLGPRQALPGSLGLQAGEHKRTNEKTEGKTLCAYHRFLHLCLSSYWMHCILYSEEDQ